jgi:hypothetical protein
VFALRHSGSALARHPLSALPAAFWTDVSAGARWRCLLWEGHPGWERALQALVIVALAGALLGLYARTCCAIAGLLLYHLAPLETLFYTPSPWAKGLTIVVLGLIVLAVSPCDDALALRRGRARREDWEYRWPLRLLQLFVAQPYLFSLGQAPVRGAGLHRRQHPRLAAALQRDDQLVVFTAPGLWIADRLPCAC